MKQYLLICIIILFASSAYSQVTLGPKIGLNESIVGKFKYADSFLTAAHFGGSLNIPFNHHLAMGIELLYSIKGSKTQRSSTKFHYITLPILLKVYPFSKFRMNAQVGIQPSIFVESTYNTSDGFSGVSGFKDEFNRFELSIPFGLGYDISSHLGFDLRYVMGVTDIYKLGSSVGGPGVVHNHVFQLAIFYRFKL